jgi:hypothetical protein
MHRKTDEKSNLRQHHYDFKVGNASYIAWPVRTGLPLIDKANKECSLVTLITAQAEDIQDEKWLETTLRAFRTTRDDVWSAEFLDGLLLDVQGPDMESSLSPALVEGLQHLASWYAVLTGLGLPVGPLGLDMRACILFTLTGWSISADAKQSQSSVPRI